MRRNAKNPILKLRKQLNENYIHNISLIGVIFNIHQVRKGKEISLMVVVLNRNLVLGFRKGANTVGRLGSMFNSCRSSSPNYDI